MWIYHQATGKLYHDTIEVAHGYSGAGSSKNKPSAQNIPDEGPIPQGLYTIEPPKDTAMHGPFVLPLQPDPKNEMFGRFGFLIHGDSIRDPGCASEGCIILYHKIRQRIWESNDHELSVVV